MKHSVATNDPRGDQAREAGSPGGRGSPAGCRQGGGGVPRFLLSCPAGHTSREIHGQARTASNPARHAAPRPAQGHNGPPFMTFHRAFLLEMERSLLAVAPALGALPYWDITVSAQGRAAAHVRSKDGRQAEQRQAEHGAGGSPLSTTESLTVHVAALRLQLDNPGTGKYFGTPKTIFSKKYAGQNDGDPRVGAGVTSGAAPLALAGRSAGQGEASSSAIAPCSRRLHGPAPSSPACAAAGRTDIPLSRSLVMRQCLHPMAPPTQECLRGARSTASSPPSGPSTSRCTTAPRSASPAGPPTSTPTRW